MAIYRFDIFQMDTQLYRLSRHGEPVTISAKPFDLLHYLIRYRDRIVSRRELTHEVWNAETISRSSVPTCIRAIRFALGDTREPYRFIETYRARGYRFIAQFTEQRSCPTAPSGPSSRSLDIPFVGRDVEMNIFSAALARASKGTPQVYLVLGNAGLGKTRLLDEFARNAEHFGAAVLFGRCSEDDGAPAFWPWIQILRAYVETSSADTLSRHNAHVAAIYQMLPEMQQYFPSVPHLADVEPRQARFRLFDGVSRFVQAAASARPVVLFFDDLHKADTSSILLLDFLVRDLRHSRVLLVGAYRDTEVRSGTTSATSLSSIVSSSIARSTRLREFARADVAQMVGHPDHSELVSDLFCRSEGNPFFLTQLIHYCATDPVLADTSVVRRTLSPVPVGVRNLISSQFETLPESTKNVLIAASIIGRDFELPLLAKTLGVTIPALLEFLDLAVDARVIELTDEVCGAYRFTHSLVRDFAYSTTSSRDRAQMHQQVGLALESLHAPDFDAHIEQLAYHFSNAVKLDNALKAVTYSIRAGESVSARLAHENAPEYFQSALNLLDYHTPPDPRLRCEILISLGASLLRAGNRDAARGHLLHAGEIAQRICEPTLVARAALELAPGFFAIEVGTHDHQLETLLKTAQRSLPTSEVDLHVRIAARLAHEAVWSSTPSACALHSAEALRIAAEATDPATKAYALSARHSALWGAQRFKLRQLLIAEIESFARQTDDGETALMSRILKITILLEAGSMDDVDAEIRSYARLANRLQLPHAQWYVSLFGAMRLLMQGRFADAKNLADRFLILGNRVKDRNAPQSFGAHLVLRKWEENALDEVLPALDQLISDYPSIVAWQCVRAFCLSELRRAEARDLFDHLAVDKFAKIPSNEAWTIAMTMLAVTAVNLHELDRISEIYELLLPGESFYTIVGYGVMSFGSRARELGNLATALGEFERAEEHFQFAISQNQRAGSPPWVATSRMDYASMLARRRDSKDKRTIRLLIDEALQSGEKFGMTRLKLQAVNLVRQL